MSKQRMREQKQTLLSCERFAKDPHAQRTLWFWSRCLRGRLVKHPSEALRGALGKKCAGRQLDERRRHEHLHGGVSTQVLECDAVEAGHAELAYGWHVRVAAAAVRRRGESNLNCLLLLVLTGGNRIETLEAFLLCRREALRRGRRSYMDCLSARSLSSSAKCLFVDVLKRE